MNSADSMGLSDLPMPDLDSAFPGPFPTSPHADHVEQQALRWLGEFPLLAPSDALRTLCNITGQGVARTFPAAGRDSLVLCAHLFLWLTAFDDVHGEAAAVRDTALLVDHVSELTIVLADGDVPATASPFAAALQDLLARFRAGATPAQYLRLAGHLRDNLFGIVWEAHHLVSPEQVTVREYCAMRPYTVFVRTIMAAAEIVLGYELSDEQRSLAPVRQLEKAVANLGGWINDLASYRREAARMGMNPLSLPTLLMAEHSLGLQKAVQVTSRMCEEQAAVARSRINELTAGTTSTLAVHARALENIAHSYVWHTGHARYR